MKYHGVINLHDAVTKELEFIDVFQNKTLEEIREHLNTLQLQYCEDEKPIISKRINKNGIFLIAESDCDFMYVAKLETVKIL